MIVACGLRAARERVRFIVFNTLMLFSSSSVLPEVVRDGTVELRCDVAGYSIQCTERERVESERERLSVKRVNDLLS